MQNENQSDEAAWLSLQRSGDVESRSRTEKSRKYLRGSGFWQQKEEGGPVSHGALHADGAAVVEYDMFYDRQAQSGTAAFARTGLIDAVKAFKDPRQMFRSDAGAEVAHKKFNAVFAFMRTDNDLLAVLGVAQGIADQVAEDLMHGVTVGHNRPVVNVFHNEFNLGGAGIFLHRGNRLRQQMARG